MSITTENKSLRECPKCGRAALLPEAMDALEEAGLVGSSSVCCMKDNQMYIHPRYPLVE